jgi:outer membrane lipoprotein carrier protein
LKPLPAADGLEWVQAIPRRKDEAIGFTSLRVGFRAATLAAIELTDSFGQRSRLNFTDVVTNAAISPETFRFTPPKGAEVLTQ